jgi:hypothetical protein
VFGISANFLKERQVDFALLLELHTDTIARVDLVHGATHDIRSEDYTWRAVERDARNHEWHIHCRMPLLAVDGEGVYNTRSRNNFRRYILGEALPTDRAWWMHEGFAVLAPHHFQFTVRSSRPEGAIVSVQPWQ